MKPTPFPPLTRRQRKLLEDLRAAIKKLKTLPIENFTTWTKIRKTIDDLSVRVARFALKPLQAKTRQPGFFLEAHRCGGRLSHVSQEIKPGFGVFHPEIPTWAKKHLVDWVQMLRLQRADAREVLRETGVVSIETGLKRPGKFADIECWELIKQRVLEIRGVKDEELCEKMNGLAESNNAPPNTLTEMLEVLRKKRKVTGEMLKKAKLQVEAASEKKEKRTRKNKASWDYVIEKLVEEGLLQQKISRQAFKKRLKSHFPDYPWNKV